MDEESTLFIHYNFKVSFCRLIENLLVPSIFTVKAEVDIVEETGVELALRKINFWLNNYVSGALAICATNVTGFQMALTEVNTPRLQNPLMITPDEPTDDHLCVLLQSKLQALAGGAFAVGMIELSSDNAEGLTFTYVGDSEEILPEMSAWMVGPTWFDCPWWNRDDASMFDTLAPEGADLSEKPTWAASLDFLAREMMPQEAIILRGDFSPRIIDDGDPDQ